MQQPGNDNIVEDERSDPLVKGLNLDADVSMSAPGTEGGVGGGPSGPPDVDLKFVTAKSKIQYEQLLVQVEDNERIMREYQIGGGRGQQGKKS